MEQYVPTAPYRRLISQFVVAMAALAGKSALEGKIPPSVLGLAEMGQFTPTQPVRDASKVGGKMGGRWRADAAGGTNPFFEQQPGDERGEAVERALRGPRTLYCRTWDRTEFLSARAHGDACV